MQHAIEVNFEQKNTTQPMMIYTKLNNSFFVANMTHAPNGTIFNYTVNLKLPSGYQVINVTYIHDVSTDQDYYFVGTNTTFYFCNSTKEYPRIFNYNCSILFVSRKKSILNLFSNNFL